MENFTNMTSQEYIPLSLLNPSPLNTFEIGDIEDLKNSIRSLGILSPLSVIGPFPDNTYTILAGERRYRAACELESEEEEEIIVPCHIVGNWDLNETTQQLIIESSNVETRDDFNRLEHQFRIVELLKQIYDSDPDMRHKDFVKAVQKHMKTSKRYSRMYVQVFESASPSVRDMVRDGKLAVSQAARLSSMPEEIQNKAVEDLKNGSSQKEVIEKYIKKEKTPEHDFVDIPQNDVFHEEENQATQKSENTKFTKSEYDDVFSDMDLSDVNSMMEAIGDLSSACNVDNVDVNLDPSGQFKSVMARNADSDERVEKTRIANVISWCKKILKNGPGDEDWEAIDYCKKVADRF